MNLLLKRLQTHIRLRRHNRQIQAIAHSGLNKWGTGETIGRSPDPNSREGRNQLVLHLIETGAIDRLQKQGIVMIIAT